MLLGIFLTYPFGLIQRTSAPVFPFGEEDPTVSALKNLRNFFTATARNSLGIEQAGRLAREMGSRWFLSAINDLFFDDRD